MMENSRYSTESSPALMSPAGSSPEESANLLAPSMMLHRMSEKLYTNHKRRCTTSSYYHSRCRIFLLVLGLLLSLATMAGLAIFIASRSDSIKNNQQASHRLPSLHLAGEINGLVPEFSIRPFVFHKDPLATPDHETAESERATEENWLSYQAEGKGFIFVNNSRKYTLPPRIEYKGLGTYAIAVFHQLHCLHTIMTMYNEAVASSNTDGIPRRRRGNINEEKHGHGGGGHGHDHIDHCFRYLRQSIICCGDTALEGQDPNSSRPATDGTGAVHLCKDHTEVMAWAASRRVRDGNEL
ncbi:hypothetical protein B0T17DRAFT_541426 [Bombardia bombarda]|uniref:Tat pathway signal sequence n=1 Tax=Bombardia bombarda TaxID=252184 RepID=A0AA39WH01_9PEZI|nr:hypothetical protein B0T17DRAFT_541426 [Bombardia bombarda]